MSTSFDITPLKKWGIPFDKYLTIAGPCSAESREQLLEVGTELSKNSQVNLFRAGIWKPRTKPGNFEGHGEKALPWLKELKEKTGLKTTIEVANPKHVELALKYDVDVLWVGARTTVSPFVIQDIADSLQGVDIPILIKNPVNPDMDLWVGGVERIHKAGIKKIGLIHRGFSMQGNPKLRNQPQWQLIIDLKRKYPEIPIICDPSHICGQRESLFEIAQTALDLSLDGVMLESHTNPDKAWSDAKQQITPETLGEFLKKLIQRDATTPDDIFNNTLKVLREDIDDLDNKILQLLKVRMGVVQTIGLHKKKSNVTVLQSERWDSMLEKRVSYGKNAGLGEQFTERLFKAIHDESIKIQESVMNTQV